MMTELESRLRSSLVLDIPYPERSGRKGGTPAAVLVLFGKGPEGPSVLLIRRTELVETHKGQMAFPGGMCEPDELQEQLFEKTALRETEEEVGIPPALVRLIGHLPPLPTVTGFQIHPMVGVLSVSIEEVPLKLSPMEIDEAIWIPLSTLTSPETYRRETIEHGGLLYPIHVFQVGKHRIWGATGAMIRNLLDRLSSATGAAGAG